MKITKLFPPFERNAEVLMVIYLPNKKILLQTKSFYPNGVYRIFSGGLKKNETPKGAFDRELKEETDVVAINKQFLGKIIFRIKHSKGVKNYRVYVFLVKSKSNVVKNLHGDKYATKFRQVKISELPQIAKKLEMLQKGPKSSMYPVSNWNEWGKFRSKQHSIVYKLLKNYLQL